MENGTILIADSTLWNCEDHRTAPPEPGATTWPVICHTDEHAITPHRLLHTRELPLLLTTVMRPLLPSLIRPPMVLLPMGKPSTAASDPFITSNAVVMVGVRGSTAAEAMVP